MKSVFTLEHLRVDSRGREHYKFIGVYRTARTANAAVARLKGKPGFRDNPRVIRPGSDEESGFYINQYELNEDHWTEGFGPA